MDEQNISKPEKKMRVSRVSFEFSFLPLFVEILFRTSLFFIYYKGFISTIVFVIIQILLSFALFIGFVIRHNSITKRYYEKNSINSEVDYYIKPSKLGIIVPWCLIFLFAYSIFKITNLHIILQILTTLTCTFAYIFYILLIYLCSTKRDSEYNNEPRIGSLFIIFLFTIVPLCLIFLDAHSIFKVANLHFIIQIAIILICTYAYNFYTILKHCSFFRALSYLGSAKSNSEFKKESKSEKYLSDIGYTSKKIKSESQSNIIECTIIAGITISISFQVILLDKITDKTFNEFLLYLRNIFRDINLNDMNYLNNLYSFESILNRIFFTSDHLYCCLFVFGTLCSVLFIIIIRYQFSLIPICDYIDDLGLLNNHTDDLSVETIDKNTYLLLKKIENISNTINILRLVAIILFYLFILSGISIINRQLSLIVAGLIITGLFLNMTIIYLTRYDKIIKSMKDFTEILQKLRVNRIR